MQHYNKRKEFHMDTNTQNQDRPVALVTGAARGIGRGVAEKLAQEGFNIAIADILDNDGEAVTACEKRGANALFIKSDIGSSQSRAEIIEAVRTRFGRLNILVNNAGVAPKVRADILEATEESYDFVMNINLKGPYFLTQLAANWMIEQKMADTSCKACIINISSISATVVSPSRGEYCLSKAGVSMATQLWAARLGEFGIPVYEIRPGVIRTDMTVGVREKYDRLIAEGLCIQPRWGQPSDIANAVASFARGDFAYSTGQAVYVDGGMTVQRL
jgi:NAD(P)-dependent dehydrogenase (short-subunit alcohol dehydrogenase family)